MAGRISGAAKLVIEKYGEPGEVTDNELSDKDLDAAAREGESRS